MSNSPLKIKVLKFKQIQFAQNRRFQFEDASSPDCSYIHWRLFDLDGYMTITTTLILHVAFSFTSSLSGLRSAPCVPLLILVAEFPHINRIPFSPLCVRSQCIAPKGQCLDVHSGISSWRFGYIYSDLVVSVPRSSSTTNLKHFHQSSICS